MFCIGSATELLAVDPVQRKLYHGYTNNFASVNVNGTGHTIVFYTNHEYSYDVAIDVKKR